MLRRVVGRCFTPSRFGRSGSSNPRERRHVSSSVESPLPSVETHDEKRTTTADQEEEERQQRVTEKHEPNNRRNMTSSADWLITSLLVTTEDLFIFKV
jgi:hypothetical protein